jgi:hypothetical protein
MIPHENKQPNDQVKKRGPPKKIWSCIHCGRELSNKVNLMNHQNKCQGIPTNEIKTLDDLKYSIKEELRREIFAEYTKLCMPH